MVYILYNIINHTHTLKGRGVKALQFRERKNPKMEGVYESTCQDSSLWMLQSPAIKFKYSNKVQLL